MVVWLWRGRGKQRRNERRTTKLLFKKKIKQRRGHGYYSTATMSTEFRIPLKSGYSLFAREEKSSSPFHDNAAILLVVHGGPGLADHTESFTGLRQALQQCPDVFQIVFFYDQLGCGSSDKPVDSLISYSLEYYTSEVHEVIDFCSKRHHGQPICLLGHSWGGQIVLEYLLKRNKQDGGSAVISAIISNSPLDEDTYEQKQQTLRSALDDATRQFLEHDERQQADDGSVGSAIYTKLIGISETAVTGELKGWSVRERLKDIKVPCLFISGTYDTIPFEEYEQAAASAGHQVCILPGAGHGPFFGETAEAYFQALNEFLKPILSLPKVQPCE